MKKPVKKELLTVADHNNAAKENSVTLPNGQLEFHCACGSKSFELLQDTHNIKAVCGKCNDCRIIAWNSKGSILNLKTLQWSEPKASVIMTVK